MAERSLKLPRYNPDMDEGAVFALFGVAEITDSAGVAFRPARELKQIDTNFAFHGVLLQLTTPSGFSPAPDYQSFTVPGGQAIQVRLTSGNNLQFQAGAAATLNAFAADENPDLLIKDSDGTQLARRRIFPQGWTTAGTVANVVLSGLPAYDAANSYEIVHVPESITAIKRLYVPRESGIDGAFVIADSGVYAAGDGVFTRAQATAPLVNGFPVELGGEFYIIYENRQIWRVLGADSGMELVANDLTTLLSDLELSEADINFAIAWQGRVFLGVDDYLLWSAPGDISKWRSQIVNNDGITLATGAGYQPIPQSGGLRDMVAGGNEAYIFGQIGHVRADVADVNYQFTFTRYLENVHYYGGAIGFKDKIYALTDSGLVRLTRGRYEPVSENMRRELLGILSAGEAVISTAHFGDNIYWLFPEQGALLEYNDFYQRYRIVYYQQVLGNNVVPHILGFYRQRGETIGDLSGTIGSFDWRIGDGGGEQIVPVALLNNGHLAEWQLPTTSYIDLNLRLNPAGADMMIYTLTLPELQECRVRVREHNENDWGPAIGKDRFGDNRIERPFHSPDVRVEIPGEWTEIRRLDIIYEDRVL